jgi:spore germination protein (amino acid permease)
MSITSYQFILIIYGTQVGIDVLSLPRELAEKAGTSGWISLIIGGSLSTLMSCIYVKLREKSPNTNLPDYFQYYLGAFLGRIISFILVIYLMFLGYWTLLRVCLLIRSYVLDDVSMVMLLLLLFIPTYQLVTGGIQLIAKYMEATFPIVLLFFVALLVVLERAQYEFLLPIIKEGWMPIVKTVYVSTLPYHGFGMIIAVYPYLKEKEKAMKGVIIANALSTGVYLFTALICFVIYSPYEIQRVFQPVLEMLSVIEFQFVERVDFIVFFV